MNLISGAEEDQQVLKQKTHTPVPTAVLGVFCSGPPGP